MEKKIQNSSILIVCYLCKQFLYSFLHIVKHFFLHNIPTTFSANEIFFFIFKIRLSKSCSLFEDNFGQEGSFVNCVSTLGYSVDPVDPDDGQTIIPMPCNQESSNATNVANAFNGLEALSEMQSLKFRKPKFEKQAHYIIIYIRTVRPYLLDRANKD